MLNEIKEKLENLNLGPVEYGRVTNDPNVWNYAVFARRNMSRAGASKIDFNRYYTVVVVHEDYIPEGTEVEVIKALKEINGLHLATDDIQYDYTVKRNSDTVVEMAVMTFYEIVKGHRV